MTTNTSLLKKSFLSIFSRLSAFSALFFLVSCTSVLPDCNVCSSPPLNALNGHWTLVRWNLPPQNGQIKFRTIPEITSPDHIFIDFDASKNLLSGSTGCNHFFSNLKEDSKGAIVLGPIGSTRKMCLENQRNLIEKDFLNVLEDYRSWQQNQNQLLLFGKSGDVLVFARNKTN
ncbi:META domain-containing protein [Polynucleobacter kasalickyi]|uniref:Heat shock protein HslJ n=1 Tax=Polynucleobacter kasalickyi TaxID=1938817 RepID=A0A1W1YCM8_9BURK|nr:META domain-containing protein [Polynucleobacter kasalickyi]SMC33518.1 Heat shock protein HslJ [Polynucleobacter kasalickyi]